LVGLPASAAGLMSSWQSETSHSELYIVVYATYFGVLLGGVARFSRLWYHVERPDSAY